MRERVLILQVLPQTVGDLLLRGRIFLSLSVILPLIMVSFIGFFLPIF